MNNKKVFKGDVSIDTLEVIKMKYEVKDTKINIEFGTDILNGGFQTRVIAFLELLNSVQDMVYREESKKAQDDAIIEKTRQAAIESEKHARSNVENNTPLEAPSGSNINDVSEEPSDDVVVNYEYSDTVEQELPPLMEQTKSKFDEPEIEEDV